MKNILTTQQLRKKYDPDSILKGIESHYKKNLDKALYQLNLAVLKVEKAIKDPFVIEGILDECSIMGLDNFSDQDWKSLYKLAEDTFVEETDSLKEGAAGAGLTDND